MKLSMMINHAAENHKIAKRSNIKTKEREGKVYMERNLLKIKKAQIHRNEKNIDFLILVQMNRGTIC